MANKEKVVCAWCKKIIKGKLIKKDIYIKRISSLPEAKKMKFCSIQCASFMQYSND